MGKNAKVIPFKGLFLSPPLSEKGFFFMLGASKGWWVAALLAFFLSRQEPKGKGQKVK